MDDLSLQAEKSSKPAAVKWTKGSSEILQLTPIRVLRCRARDMQPHREVTARCNETRDVSCEDSNTLHSTSSIFVLPTTHENTKQRATKEKALWAN